MDQPARPRVRLPAPDRPARRSLRRGGVLPDVLDHPPAAGRGSRVRGPRVPPERQRGRVRQPRGPAGAGRPAGDGRRGDLAAHALPRAVRAGADGAVHGRRPRSGDDRGRPGRCRDSRRGAGALHRGARARPASAPDRARRGTTGQHPPLDPAGGHGGPPPAGAGRRHGSAQPRRLPARPAAIAASGARSRSGRPPSSRR